MGCVMKHVSQYMSTQTIVCVKVTPYRKHVFVTLHTPNSFVMTVAPGVMSYRWSCASDHIG
jgi:hypothetical protein